VGIEAVQQKREGKGQVPELREQTDRPEEQNVRVYPQTTGRGAIFQTAVQESTAVGEAVP